MDPIETAADNLSTLAWRVCARKRGATHGDPAIVRHLYDLAAIEGYIAKASGFAALAQKTAAADCGTRSRMWPRQYGGLKNREHHPASKNDIKGLPQCHQIALRVTKVF